MNNKGFLIIELLVALGLLAIFILLLGKYQLQLNLYKQAASQLYQATNLCENIIEELLAGAHPLKSQSRLIDNFTISTSITPGPGQAFCYVEVCANWLCVLERNHKIKFETICLN